MKRDYTDDGWSQLQQRLEQKFSRYLQNESENSESKQQTEETFTQELQLLTEQVMNVRKLSNY